MKIYTLPNGSTIQIGQPFSIGDVDYSSDFLAKAMNADLHHAGITVSESDPPQPPLEETKAALIGRLNEDAEGVRLRYITPGAGMAMTYAEKKDQAVAVIAMGEDAANALTNSGAAEFPTPASSRPSVATGMTGATATRTQPSA